MWLIYRIIPDTLNPEIKDVDLSDLFAVVCRTIEVPNNVVLSTNVSKFSLKTDKEFIRRALVNLVTNAIQAIAKWGKSRFDRF